MKRDSDETIKTEFEDLIKAGERVYPGLTDQINTFVSNKVDFEDYEAYLNLINQTPCVVTANSAT